MSIITTIIILSMFYGSGAIICHTADTGTCRNEVVVEEAE